MNVRCTSFEELVYWWLWITGCCIEPYASLNLREYSQGTVLQFLESALVSIWYWNSSIPSSFWNLMNVRNRPKLSTADASKAGCASTNQRIQPCAKSASKKRKIVPKRRCAMPSKTGHTATFFKYRCTGCKVHRQKSCLWKIRGLTPNLHCFSRSVTHIQPVNCRWRREIPF